LYEDCRKFCDDCKKTVGSLVMIVKRLQEVLWWLYEDCRKFWDDCMTFVRSFVIIVKRLQEVLRWLFEDPRRFCEYQLCPQSDKLQYTKW